MEINKTQTNQITSFSFPFVVEIWKMNARDRGGFDVEKKVQKTKKIGTE